MGTSPDSSHPTYKGEGALKTACVIHGTEKADFPLPMQWGLILGPEVTEQARTEAQRSGHLVSSSLAVQALFLLCKPSPKEMLLLILKREGDEGELKGEGMRRERGRKEERDRGREGEGERERE